MNTGSTIAKTQGRIAAWLSTAANEVARGFSDLRMHRKWGRPIDLERAESTAAATLKVIDNELAKTQWLTGNLVSISDLAVYPYTALAPEGGVDLKPHTNILRWFEDLRALPGYVGMPGMWEA
ncbi:hypothetical protein CCP4SC76_5940002 [Gammaproteobacteria bacterium]